MLWFRISGCGETSAWASLGSSPGDTILSPTKLQSPAVDFFIAVLFLFLSSAHPSNSKYCCHQNCRCLGTLMWSVSLWSVWMWPTYACICLFSCAHGLLFCCWPSDMWYEQCVHDMPGQTDSLCVTLSANRVNVLKVQLWVPTLTFSWNIIIKLNISSFTTKFALWENTSLHFLTIDSEFKELICIECKTSSLTWKLESPQVQTGPTLSVYCKDKGNNERL